MEDLITPAQAAELRGVTRAAISALVRRGRLRTHEIAGKIFLYRSDVESFEPTHAGWPKGKLRKAPSKNPTAQKKRSKK